MENSSSIQKLQESEETNYIQQNTNNALSEINNIKTVNQEDDYNSFIIKPPPKRDILKSKMKTLFIDSRDRNITKFQTSSKFEINLKEEYKYVKSLNLVMAQIPPSQYMVNDNNNILNFYIGDDKEKEESLIIENGNYPDPNPINNYLPNILPSLEILESIIYPNINLYQDLLSYTIQEEILKKIIYTNELKYVIEVGYNFIKDNYFFLSDLSPCEGLSEYEGSKLNLCFLGNTDVPYGAQEINSVPKIDIYNRIVKDSEGKTIYEKIQIGEKTNVYKKNSIGKILGFQIKNYDGHLTQNISNDENPLIFTIKAIKVNTTKFTRKLKKNTYIIVEQEIDNYKYSQRFKVKKLLSDYSFEIYDPNNEETGRNAPLIPPGNPNINGGVFIFTEGNLFQGFITGENRKDYTKDRYVIMKIKPAYKIDSENDSAQNSFAIIPFPLIITNTIVEDYSNSIWSRNFNPPLPKLSEFKVEFLNYDGSLYNFEGQEINLEFVVETLNQSIKYS